MKSHYPQEYMSAIMTAESGDLEKVSEVMSECKRMGMEILPPDVNESFSDFTVVVVPKDEAETEGLSERTLSLIANTPDGDVISHRIRFGLRNIKNFGEEIGKIVIQERKRNGKFKSIEDFLERVQHKNLNRKSLEALILSGAFDSLSNERAVLMAGMEAMQNFNRSFRMQNEDQISLFGGLDSAPSARLTLPEAEPMNNDAKLAHEKELLGLYVSGHPLHKFKERLEKSGSTIKKISQHATNEKTVIFGAIITEAKVILTKKQQRMAFITLSDHSGSIETVVFPKTYQEFQELLEPDTCVVCKGKVSDRNGERSILADKFKLLE
jgi:DNA polymerase-3 subunit alpha